MQYVFIILESFLFFWLSFFFADESLTTPEEIPEDLQSQLLADYEKECQSRLAGEEKDRLKCKEKGDMVLVSRSGDSGSTSPGKGIQSHPNFYI